MKHKNNLSLDINIWQESKNTFCGRAIYRTSIGLIFNYKGQYISTSVSGPNRKNVLEQIITWASFVEDNIIPKILEETKIN